MSLHSFQNVLLTSISYLYNLYLIILSRNRVDCGLVHVSAQNGIISCLLLFVGGGLLFWQTKRYR
jgi:hypothetical protein